MSLFFAYDPDSEGTFLRGDCNADGVLDVTDPVANLGFQLGADSLGRIAGVT